MWYSVPSLVSFLQSSRRIEPESAPRAAPESVAAERLTYNTYRLWKSVAPNTRVLNLYGPTETTIVVTHFEVPEGFRQGARSFRRHPHRPTLSRPGLELRREDGSPVAMGEAGELWIAGDQVTAGYLGDPDTHHRTLRGARWRHLVPDRRYRPVGPGVWPSIRRASRFAGQRSWATVSGSARFEHALMKITGCALAAAGVAALHDEMPEIFAVLPESLASEKKVIREKLKELLPSYMLPRHYFFLVEFPLNPSGKLDREVLRQWVLDLSRSSP